GVELRVAGDTGLKAVDRIDGARRGLSKQRARWRWGAGAHPLVPSEEHRTYHAVEVQGVERRWRSEVGSTGNLVQAIVAGISTRADHRPPKLGRAGYQLVRLGQDEDHLADAYKGRELLRKILQKSRVDQIQVRRPPNVTIEQRKVEQTLPARAV